MKITCYLSAMLACAAVAGLASCSSSGSNDPYEGVDYLPVKISEKDNWSFYGADGTIKYEDEFKNEPSVVYNGYFSVMEGDSYTLYRAGEKPEVVKGAEGLVSVGAMSEGLVPVVFPKERICFINGDGEKIFTLEPVDGKEITECGQYFTEGLIPVMNEEGKFGYVDTKGNVLGKIKWEFAPNFSCGLAVVSDKDEDDEISYAVIDTKGETVFTLRDGSIPQNYLYTGGLLPVKDSNERIVLYDTKGEIVFKCPSKVMYVNDIKGNIFSFMDEDFNHGIMNLEGETVVRAKYKGVYLISGDSYLCVDEEGSADILNANGDVRFTIDDFKEVNYLGHFGFLGRDRHTFSFLDAEGKAVKNAEFDEVALSYSHLDGVTSDYFNTEAVVNDICSLISDNGVDKYTLGANPSAIFSDPSDYTYKRWATIPGLEREGYRYSIHVDAIFDGIMADYNYSGYNYSRNYYWMSNTECYRYDIEIVTQTEWGNSGSEAVTAALIKKGFKKQASTSASDERYVTLLAKGNILVQVQSTKGGTNGTVMIFKNTPETREALTAEIDDTVVEAVVEDGPMDDVE